MPKRFQTEPVLFINLSFKFTFLFIIIIMDLNVDNRGDSVISGPTYSGKNIIYNELSLTWMFYI